MRHGEREWMKRAVEQAKRCLSEGGKPRPHVGAVVVKDDVMVDEGYRGEKVAGDHAEFTVLQRKLAAETLSGATLYTTLEPCTNRVPPNESCTQHILNRGIARVVIGIVDPNETIRGNGIWALRQRGIEVEFFDPDLMKVIEDLNADFIAPHLATGAPFRPPHFLKLKQRRLDDWYHLINAVFIDKNYYRTPSSVFSHVVEVMGGLSLLATGKKKPDINPGTYIPKALAWWLALCGKVGIRSVEDLIWSKFPGVCSYCMESPHKQAKCQQVKREHKNPDWKALNAKGVANRSQRPWSLSEWQQMFNTVYQAQQTEPFDAVFGRFSEELGELAEAVRVVDAVPQYFISEAADVFAWLMHLANLIDVKEDVYLVSEEDLAVHNPVTDGCAAIEFALYREYPDRCAECSRPVCACPPILPRTLGRLAHEGPESDELFLKTNDMAARFNVGVTRIAIADEYFDVTAEVVTAVYHSLAAILESLQREPYTTPQLAALTVAVGEVLALAVAQRVSQRSLDNFLKWVLYLNSGDMERLRGVISRQSVSPWRDAFLRYLSEAYVAV